MADTALDALVRDTYRLVAEDTDGLTRRGQLPEVSDALRMPLLQLAHNRDVPARLSPSREAVLRAAGERPAADQRERVRAALGELVAQCANSLDTFPLPPAADTTVRNRLSTAISRAYAANATPRLVARLFPTGRPDDLGWFPPPQLEGDVAAARALAIAIGARSGMREDDVLRNLVTDGPGSAGFAAAELLLRHRPDFLRLPEGEQRDAVREQVADNIEVGFSVRDVRQAAAREVTEELENRREDVTGGAGTIDLASRLATEELGRLQESLQEIDDWQQPGDPQQPGNLAARPQSLDELLRRVHETVGELTGAEQSAWNGSYADMPDLPDRAGQVPDGTLQIRWDAVQQLGRLTQHGPESLVPWQVREAREALREVTAEFARMAGHPRGDGPVATQSDNETDAMLAERVVADGFAAENLNDVAAHTLPAELADRIMTSEPSARDLKAEAARGFANHLDLRSPDTEPGESLRRMAGSGDPGAAAAEILTADSSVTKAARPGASLAIRLRVNLGLTDRPRGADAWAARIYGRDLARAVARDVGDADDSTRFAADSALRRPRAASASAAATVTTKSSKQGPAPTRDR